MERFASFQRIRSFDAVKAWWTYDDVMQKGVEIVARVHLLQDQAYQLWRQGKQ